MQRAAKALHSAIGVHFVHHHTRIDKQNTHFGIAFVWFEIVTSIRRNLQSAAMSPPAPHGGFCFGREVAWINTFNSNVKKDDFLKPEYGFFFVKQG